ncbi:MAG: helix-turn-helix domain-containing protein [Actinobacteria bacterium]|nr:helix-turn-helix domain-containing protein [Actinomycetota bacterium]MBO0818091.1 helix-turn-helix domain-containing protein [Actinomycetota bacterium]
MSSDGLQRVPGPGGDATSAARARPAERGTRRLTDPRAMRALAHPVRVALLEALAHAGTLTATQASEALGESPANCAFHLRTLAKYGYVEETGGGRGRERPWRRVHTGYQFPTDEDDPQTATAVQEIADFYLDRILARARATLSRRTTWPPEWQGNELTGQSEDIFYVTPAEARELGAEIRQLLCRFDERLDHPERRPPDAMPIEVLFLGYPLLHLAAQPDPVSGDVLRAEPESD